MNRASYNSKVRMKIFTSRWTLFKNQYNWLNNIPIRNTNPSIKFSWKKISMRKLKLNSKSIRWNKKLSRIKMNNNLPAQKHWSSNEWISCLMIAKVKYWTSLISLHTSNFIRHKKQQKFLKLSMLQSIMKCLHHWKL